LFSQKPHLADLPDQQLRSSAPSLVVAKAFFSWPQALPSRSPIVVCFSWGDVTCGRRIVRKYLECL